MTQLQNNFQSVRTCIWDIYVTKSRCDTVSIRHKSMASLYDTKTSLYDTKTSLHEQHKAVSYRDVLKFTLCHIETCYFSSWHIETFFCHIDTLLCHRDCVLKRLCHYDIVTVFNIVIYRTGPNCLCRYSLQLSSL